MDLDEVDLQRLMKTWDPVTNLRWKPSSGANSVVASVDTKGEFALWDVPRNAESRPTRCLGQVATGGPLAALAWCNEGSSVAVAGGDKVIKLYDVQEEFGKSILTAGSSFGEDVAFCGRCTGHTLKIVSLCTHPTTPQVLVSAGLDRQILIWDMRAGKTPQHSMSGPELAGDAIDISRDGNSLLTGSHRSKNPLEIYDLRMNEEAKPTVSYAWRGNEESSEGGGRWTTSLLFSACWDEWENKYIVAAGGNENLGRVYERSADPGEPLRIVGTVRGKDKAFWSSAIATEGRTAALGSADGAVCLVDLTRK
jgi:WD40 repeat protein